MSNSDDRWRWAQYSKEHGKGGDYRILQASAPEADWPELAAFARRLVPGNPSQHDGLAKPPWVMFGGQRSATHGFRFSVATLVWTDPPQFDAVRRRIASVSYLDCDFTALAGAGTGLPALMPLIADFRIPGPAPALVLAPTDTGPTLEALEQDLEWYSGVAAAVLDGPVTIVDSEGLSIGERVAVMETVLSLLPFGLRGDLVVSTFSDIATNVEVRLGFGDRAGRPGEVSWRVRKPPTPSPAAAQYVNWLRRLPSIVDGGLAGTLAALRSLTAVRPATGTAASEAIRPLYLPRVVWEASGTNQVRPDQIRLALRDGVVPALSEPRWRELLVLGVEADLPDLAELLRRFPTALRSSALAIAALRAANPTAVQRVLALADTVGVGQADVLLDVLDWLSTEGLAARVVATFAATPPPATGNVDGLIKQLRKQPYLMADVVTALFDQKEYDQARLWMEALPKLSTLRAFKQAIDGKAIVTGDLIGVRDRDLVHLARAARRSNGVGSLLRSAWVRIVGMFELVSGQERDELARALHLHDASSAADRALSDLLAAFTATDNGDPDPAALPDGQQWRNEYAQQAALALAALGHHPDPAVAASRRRRIIAGLVERLLRPQPARQDAVDVLLRLLTALTGDARADLLDLMTRAVEDGRLPLAALAGDDAVVTAVVDASPALQDRKRTALDRLHQILTDQAISEEMLARAWSAGATAYQHGARADDLVAVGGATAHSWDAWFWIAVVRGISDVVFYRTRDGGGRRLREQLDVLLLAGRAPHLRVETYRERLDAWAQHSGASQSPHA
nr:hypothetical protein GCM10020063_084860 [Dactylosporangium thailandense]